MKTVDCKCEDMVWENFIDSVARALENKLIDSLNSFEYKEMFCKTDNIGPPDYTVDHTAEFVVTLTTTIPYDRITKIKIMLNCFNGNIVASCDRKIIEDRSELTPRLIAEKVSSIITKLTSAPVRGTNYTTKKIIIADNLATAH